MLAIEEWRSELQRLNEERGVLDRSYERLRARLAGLADQGQPDEEPGSSPEVNALVLDLVAAVETDRQHISALWRLLADALQRNFRNLHQNSVSASENSGANSDRAHAGNASVNAGLETVVLRQLSLHTGGMTARQIALELRADTEPVRRALGVLVAERTVVRLGHVYVARRPPGPQPPPRAAGS
jgi:hypothetical protein